VICCVRDLRIAFGTISLIAERSDRDEAMFRLRASRSQIRISIINVKIVSFDIRLDVPTVYDNTREIDCVRMYVIYEYKRILNRPSQLRFAFVLPA